MAIKCCKGCVAPKRHTACWDHCPEYAAEKAEHERGKAEHEKKEKVRKDIYSQRSANVTKALKKHRRG